MRGGKSKSGNRVEPDLACGGIGLLDVFNSSLSSQFNVFFIMIMIITSICEDFTLQ